MAESSNNGYIVKATGAQGTIARAGSTAAFTNHRQSDPGGVSIRVVKQWYGDNSMTRPTSITVQLYRNGTPVDTATLSAGNNWSKTWYGLSGAFSWTIDEIGVPLGYTKQVVQSNGSVIITNTQYTNYQLPKTGAEDDLTLAYASLAGGILCIAIILMRKKKPESR